MVLSVYFGTSTSGQYFSLDTKIQSVLISLRGTLAGAGHNRAPLREIDEERVKDRMATFALGGREIFMILRMPESRMRGVARDFDGCEIEIGYESLGYFHKIVYEKLAPAKQCGAATKRRPA